MQSGAENGAEWAENQVERWAAVAENNGAERQRRGERAKSVADSPLPVASLGAAGRVGPPRVTPDWNTKIVAKFRKNSGQTRSDS